MAVRRTKRSASRSRPTPGEVAQVVQKYMPMVRLEATRVLSSSPDVGIVEYDDLVSFGVEGLIRAYESFDPESSTKFSAYALPHVRRTILDAVEVTRSLPPSVVPFERLAEKLGLRDRHASSSEHEVVHDELQRKLRTAIARLDQREQAIIQKYYMQALPYATVAKSLGISESRVRQLHRRILRRLRESLDLEDVAAEKTSAKELRGLGGEFWRTLDVDSHLRGERASWG